MLTIDRDKIKHLREKGRLTLAEAAERAGWGNGASGRSRWCNLENGNCSSNVKLSTLYDLAVALQVDPKTLLVNVVVLT